MKPKITDHPEYYGYYINLVKQEQVVNSLTEKHKEVLEFLRTVDPGRGDYAYGEGKWTLKEVLIHCMDTERIFSTRALCFARGEKQKMLPFDENSYAPNSGARLRSLESIAKEFESVGNSTFQLFSSFDETTLELSGETPFGPATVNAVGFMISGHTQHHLNVIRERYLK